MLIEVEAPPGQAHARLGLAIEEIKKFLVPVRLQSCNVSTLYVKYHDAWSTCIVLHVC